MKRIPLRDRASLTAMLEQAAGAEKDRIKALQTDEIDGVSGGAVVIELPTGTQGGVPGTGGTMGMIDPNPPGSDTVKF